MLHIFVFFKLESSRYLSYCSPLEKKKWSKYINMWYAYVLDFQIRQPPNKFAIKPRYICTWKELSSIFYPLSLRGWGPCTMCQQMWSDINLKVGVGMYRERGINLRDNTKTTPLLHTPWKSRYLRDLEISILNDFKIETSAFSIWFCSSIFL